MSEAVKAITGKWYEPVNLKEFLGDLTPKVKESMTVEEQIWNDLCGRKQFCTARQISRKLMVPNSTVRTYLNLWQKSDVLDVKVIGNQNFYRIKE